MYSQGTALTAVFAYGIVEISFYLTAYVPAWAVIFLSLS